MRFRATSVRMWSPLSVNCKRLMSYVVDVVPNSFIVTLLVGLLQIIHVGELNLLYKAELPVHQYVISDC